MENPSLTAPPPVREGISTSGSVRNWPQNCWWVAAHGSEIADRPVLRWVLETPIALYRKTNGDPVALHNRCPHRWAPLSMGEVAGDDLVCPYHGSQFAPNGSCVKVPTQNSAPSSLQVRSYPAIERYGFIWVWTGSADLADPELIPADLAFLSDPKWHTVWGYKSVNGNYMQIKENVLDLTHFAFLHKKSLGITGWDRAPAVEVTESRVTFRQLFHMAPLAPVYAIPAGKPPGKPINRDNWGTLVSPAVNYGAVDMSDPNPEPNGLEKFSMRIVHLTTPVSISRTHISGRSLATMVSLMTTMQCEPAPTSFWRRHSDGRGDTGNGAMLNRSGTRRRSQCHRGPRRDRGSAQSCSAGCRRRGTSEAKGILKCSGCRTRNGRDRRRDASEREPSIPVATESPDAAGRPHSDFAAGGDPRVGHRSVCR